MVPVLGGGWRGWLLPPVMEWAGMPDGYKILVEGYSKKVEESMITEAKKWHNVEGDEVVKGELMEECCRYWYTFPIKGGIAPHPVSGENDFRWVCGQIGKATSWIQRRDSDLHSRVDGVDVVTVEISGRPGSASGRRLREIQRVRQVIQERSWIPIHSVARESMLVVREKDVG